MTTIVNAALLSEGAILLARRSPHRATYPGLWSFPGGHVEGKEALADALAREHGANGPGADLHCAPCDAAEHFT